MAQAEENASGNRILRFFGLETGEKTVSVFLWSVPYLCFLGAALIGFSFLVNWFRPMPLWVHSMAVVLALLYFFLFLARVRKAGEDADSSSTEDGDGATPVDKDS